MGVTAGTFTRVAFAFLGILATLIPSRACGQILVGNLMDARTGQAIMLGYVALLTEGGDRVVWTMSTLPERGR